MRACLAISNRAFRNKRCLLNAFAPLKKRRPRITKDTLFSLFRTNRNNFAHFTYSDSQFSNVFRINVIFICHRATKATKLGIRFIVVNFTRHVFVSLTYLCKEMQSKKNPQFNILDAYATGSSIHAYIHSDIRGWHVYVAIGPFQSRRDSPKRASTARKNCTCVFFVFRSLENKNTRM